MNSSSSSHKKTPLYDLHVAAGAKMVPFGGWLMPVSYEGVLAEHKHVRENCGIFDVSHMGEVRVTGKDAAKFLQWLTINDIERLTPGSGQYSAILNSNGGMIDDLLIYRLSANNFFICVNAANRAQDFDWIKTNSRDFDVSVQDESDQWAQIAIQGPNSLKAITNILEPGILTSLQNLPYTNIMECIIGDNPAYIARTGYTGEFGFELYIRAQTAKNIWTNLIERNHKVGVKPIGLGARDTLRLEACYLLYGNDMDTTVTPLEAGISWATKLGKGDFVGRSALLEQKTTGIKRQIQAFKMIDDGIPRHGMNVFSGGQPVGHITSGSVLPSIGGAGGMVMIKSDLKEGDEIFVEIRGQHKRAKLFKRPLYVARTK